MCDTSITLCGSGRVVGAPGESEPGTWAMRGLGAHLAGGYPIDLIQVDPGPRRVGEDYFFRNHVRVGLSLTAFDLDVKQEGIVLNNALSWDYSGARIFLVLHY